MHTIMYFSFVEKNCDLNCDQNFAISNYNTNGLTIDWQKSYLITLRQNSSFLHDDIIKHLLSAYTCINVIIHATKNCHYDK